MKVAFTGKGGVGKTTLAGLLICSLANDKRRVLAVDCDPDSNLASALGFPNASKIVPISKMKNLIHERMEIKEGAPILYKLNPKIDDIPRKFVNKIDSIELIVMGTVEKGGGGCVCPESAFMRNLLSEIVLGEDEDIVMDMDPGIEHLGRRTAKSVDRFIVVVEPSVNSIDTAQKIKRLSADIGIKNVYIMGNKIRNQKDRDFIQSNFKKDGILGLLPFSEEILKIDKKSEAKISDKRITDEIEKIKKHLILNKDNYS